MVDTATLITRWPRGALTPGAVAAPSERYDVEMYTDRAKRLQATREWRWRNGTTPRPPREERFWSKVDRSGGPDACWPWIAGRFPSGYGVFQDRGRSLRSHRVAWSLTNGPIPDGAVIRHHCDNPPCCNPAHLEPGSVQENAADRVARNRQPGGELAPRAKLTRASVIEIRLRYDGRRGILTALAREYGVSRTTITRIVTGRLWQGDQR